MGLFITKSRRPSDDCNRRMLKKKSEREGFEPSVTFATPIFKIGAINHSATFPMILVLWYFYLEDNKSKVQSSEGLLDFVM